VSVIGLDIEGDYVTMVEMKETGTGPVLFNYATSAISETEKTDPDSMARLLMRLISEKNIASKDTISFISGQNIFVKFISLPQMPRDDLRQSIWWEAERSAPFSLQEALFDYHVLKEVTFEDGTKKVDVLVAAALKKSIEGHTDLLRRAGLNPVAISVKPFAVAAALKNAVARTGEKCVAIVDIGSVTTTLVVLKEGHISFIREIRIGDRDLTRAICEELGVDETEAEILKRRHGCALHEEEARLLAIAVREELDHMKDGISFWEDIQDEAKGKIEIKDISTPEGAKEAKQVSVAIRHVLEKLLGEFERSLGFYRQQAPEDRISLLILSGKGAELRDFDKLVNARMQIEVQNANPVAGVKMGSPLIDEEELKFIGPRLTAGMGLAQKSAISFINILPGRIRRAAARRSAEEGGRLSPRQIAAALVVALAALFVVIHSAQARYESDLKAINEQLARLEPSFKLAKKRRLETEQMRREISSIVTLRNQQLFWFDVLRELSHAVIHDKLWLTKAVFVKTAGKKGEVRFALQASGLAFSQTQVTEFINRLENRDYFSDVSLKTAQAVMKDEQELVSFIISCRLGKEKPESPARTAKTRKNSRGARAGK
jgi:type IV pilus assembly protein PilM